ncbi:uncharacterized protein LOC106673910 isoform X2 [Cimex lectularius]|uniref:Uncharacterized protein n=1 Tax=Cimex lectularius TaxID=79782 RepID=A0A8I6SC91_CIMLE|nr:uncharacterized protein LOC106673910 isoform X2 [Cimex lectularius]
MSKKPVYKGEGRQSKYSHLVNPERVENSFLAEIVRDDVAASQRAASVEEDKFSNPAAFFTSQTTTKKKVITVSESAAKTVGLPAREVTGESKVVQNEWAWKFQLAHDAEVQALRQGIKVKSLYSDDPRDESKKNTWGRVTIPSEDSDNQENDPWYSTDVWGDDLSEEILQQINTLDSSLMTQQKSKTPKKFVVPEKHKVSNPQKKKEDFFMSILKDDEEGFLDCLQSLDSQDSSGTAKSSSHKRKSTQILGTSAQPQPPKLSKISTQLSPVPGTSKQQPILKPSILQFSSNQPSTSSLFSPFISTQTKPLTEPGDLESSDKLSLSQRKLEKPTKSLPSASSQSFTTEWLRSQLEKVSKDYKTLKEELQTKEGETKLLRENLKSAQAEIEKHKEEKLKSVDIVKKEMEGKVKQIERQLEMTKTQMLFKTKALEAINFGGVKNLNTISNNEIINETIDEIEANVEKEDALKVEESDFEIEPYYSTEDYKQLITQIKNGKIVGRSLDMYQMIAKGRWNDFLNGKIQKKIKFTPDEDDPYREDLIAMMEELKVGPQGREFFQELGRFDTGKKLRIFLTEELTQQPSVEFNHFTMPRTDYVPSILTHADLSDKVMENYHFRRPTLVDLWDTNYNEFGPVKLSEYEKTEIGKSVDPDVSKVVLGKSRFFSTLEPVQMNLLLLEKTPIWQRKEFLLAKEIVDLVTEMARELYATLGDVRFRKEEFTLPDREPEVIEQCYDTSELDETFYPFSSKKWKDECYVELRRGVTLVGVLCACNADLTRFVLQPKGFKLERKISRGKKSRKSQLHVEQKPSISLVDSEGISNRSFRMDMDEIYTLQTQKSMTDVLSGRCSDSDEDIMQEEDQDDKAERNSVELAEKLELNFEIMLAKAEMDDDSSPSPEPCDKYIQVEKKTLPFLSTEEEIQKMREKLIKEGLYTADKELELVLNLESINANCSNVDMDTQVPQKMNIQTTQSDFDREPTYLEGTLSSRLNSLTKSNRTKIPPGPTSQKRLTKHENLHKAIISKDRSEVSRAVNAELDVSSRNIGLNLGPSDTCISEDEKITMKMIIDHINQITGKIKIYEAADIPESIDYSGLCKKENDKKDEDNLKEVRKRKAKEKIEALKSKRHELEVLGESLDACVGLNLNKSEESKALDVKKLPESRGKNMLQRVSLPSTSSAAKAESRNLLKKGSSFIKPAPSDVSQNETSGSVTIETNDPIHKNRIKIEEDDPTDGIDINPEILKKVNDYYLKKKFMMEDHNSQEFSLNSVNEAEDSDNQSEVVDDKTEPHGSEEVEPMDFRERLKIMETPRPDIEYISDLVENWMKKMKHAGLLELLCEICKDTGTMRFTPRLNALMISIIIMLQYIVQYQKDEALPHLNKIITVVREVLYTRPSPMVVCHINSFLTHAVIIKGFSKMLCHNADPRTFCADEDNKSWIRGACLLEVLCLIVDTTIDEFTNWNTSVYLSRWSHYVFCMDEAGKTWCNQESGGQRRCTCLTALINTSLNIFFNAVQEYRALSIMKNDSRKSKELMLKEVVMLALHVLHFLIENDDLFTSHIKNRLYMCAEYVKLVHQMHKNTNFQADFVLTENEVIMLEKIMSKDFIKKFLNDKPDAKLVPDFSDHFQNGAHWMSDMMSVDKLFEMDDTSSDEDW